MRHILPILALVFVTACDDGSERRSPLPQPSPVVPAPPVEPAVRGVEIVGPQVVPLGETIQFSLMAKLSDGSTRDVTAEAPWSGESHFEELMSFSGPGLVMGLASGEATFYAGFGGYSALKRVMVLPAGTFRLWGDVREAGVPTGPVVGAQVAVTGGVGVGLSTNTQEGGAFYLYGVSGETRLRVTKDGYQSAEVTVVNSDNQTWHHVKLQLLGPRADWSGTYTLTITAADHCHSVGLGEGHLPKEAWARTYQAAVRQDGPTLDVTLSGATFHHDVLGPSAYTTILGRVEPGQAVFNLAVVEELSTSTFLVLGGIVVAAGPTARLAGTFSGSFHVYPRLDDWVPPTAQCTSARHQFVLSR